MQVAESTEITSQIHLALTTYPQFFLKIALSGTWISAHLCK